ncbi:LOW QUALITY PROTEIN: olfactory receptor 2AT4 [Pipistrellus kuhlii]|uniref:LOW QUALITY PROTEIN: olfactory receptor 2AT4 n=1 Tax=Pipistrellus kuhlii TaxID=59472 RepID=UPI00174F0AC8|nr:LOW QUALITY PROTEIN: olfactory receptor 2AT4 [Pipistrellus kuhlii]
MQATACNGSKDSLTISYLTGTPSLPKYLFLSMFRVFLLLHLLIVAGHTLILVAVVAEPSLHKPMYFFLITLSVLDILSTTTTVPKMLSLFLRGDHFLSLPACFLQMYLFQSFSCSEIFILGMVANDGYVATCHPLHYPDLMTPQTNGALAASAWLMALLLPTPAVVQTPQVAFSSVAQVYHCFCDHLAMVQASCSDTAGQTLMGFCITTVMSFLHQRTPLREKIHLIYFLANHISALFRCVYVSWNFYSGFSSNIVSQGSLPWLLTLKCERPGEDRQQILRETEQREQSYHLNP